MTIEAHIFVEGSDDKKLVEAYLGVLKCPVKFRCWSLSGKDNLGKDNLGGAKVDIQKNLDDGHKVLIIFDANSDYKKSKDKIIEKLHNLDVGIFLFPDNKSKGRLEDLLVKMVKPEHKEIFKCFEAYKQCLTNTNQGYAHPDDKAKVYAYKEALDIVKLKNPFDPNYWDFSSDALRPLEKFLTDELF